MGERNLRLPYRDEWIPTTPEYIEDIVGFAHDVLGFAARPRQSEILTTVTEDQRVCVRSPRGFGKTSIAAIIALWAIACFQDVFVLMTSPSWRQLTDNLWPAIHRWCRSGSWERFGITIRPDKELTGQRLQLHPRRAIVSASPKDPEKLEGTHADVVVVIIDEAKLLTDAAWEALEGSFVGAKQYYFFVISTPGAPIGMFYDIHSRLPGFEKWNPIYVTHDEVRAEVPNFGEIADNFKAMRGEDSPKYRRDYLAEFAEDEEGALIPLEWIELSHARWHRLKNNKERVLQRVGMDVGGVGASASVVGKLYSDGFISPFGKVPYAKQGKNVNLLKSALVDKDDATIACVDNISIGSGVVEVAQDDGMPVIGINVSKPTKRKDSTRSRKFRNIRAWLFWRIRERLDPSNAGKLTLLALPPDSQLTGELTALNYEETGTGAYKIENKKEFKHRVGRSPDTADALSLMMWERPGMAKVRITEGNPFFD